LPPLGGLLPFWSIGLISRFHNKFTDGRTPRTGDQLVARPLYLNTGQHKHRKTHTHIKHPCPEWESNLRSRPPSERRQYMPQTSRLPWPACCILHYVKCCWLVSYFPMFRRYLE
jgi:hypothetical protein